MATLAAALARFAPRLPLAVAYSGGADSSALLLACARRWPQQVAAIHVHHGLQAAADAFATHCQQVCARHAIALRICRVDARAAPGQSGEDAARQARYAALAAAAHDAAAWTAFGHPLHSVLLAQHADDQVETLVLALSRGGGVAGLAAMPAYWQQHGLHWHRPLLEVPGRLLRAWLRERQHTWVEDPSNGHMQHTRNRIRTLLPHLERQLPQFRATFARSSRHCAEAAELLRELAAADLTAVGCPPHIAALQSLSRARQGNVLRHWLRTAHGTTPSAAQLDQLLHQIAACRTRAHRIDLKAGSGQVRRQGDRLHWYNRAP